MRDLLEDARVTIASVILDVFGQKRFFRSLSMEQLKETDIAHAGPAGREGGTPVMQRLSHITIHPRMPTMPRRARRGFTNQSGIACS